MTQLPESTRLIFRPIKRADLQWIIELNKDPEVMRFITGGATYRSTHTEKVIFPKLTRYNQDPSPFNFYALALKEKGSAIGWFHLKPWWGSKRTDQADIGYRLRRQYWGLGYATEATQSMIQHAFKVWHLKSLFAHSLQQNHPSQRVMQKSGMSFAGRFYYVPQLLPDLASDQREAALYQINNPDFDRKQPDSQND